MSDSRTIKLHPSWLAYLEQVFGSPELQALKRFLQQEQTNYTTYPPNNLIFNALNTTPLNAVKVVILGQDPYHGPHQANGLSFSVTRGVPPPPSLQNIFRELTQDLGGAPSRHGDLTSWAHQGVLLLNTVLTVRARSANSHRGQGWETFTDAVINIVNREQPAVAFILWGRNAREKRSLIDERKHLVITSAHPSPYSADRGFFGSRPFSKANDFLRSRDLTPVDWMLPD